MRICIRGCLIQHAPYVSYSILQLPLLLTVGLHLSKFVLDFAIASQSALSVTPCDFLQRQIHNS